MSTDMVSLKIMKCVPVEELLKNGMGFLIAVVCRLHLILSRIDYTVMFACLVLLFLLWEDRLQVLCQASEVLYIYCASKALVVFVSS